MKKYHLIIFLFLMGCYDNLTLNQLTYNDEIMYQVRVEGHVKKPGLYLVSKGSSINDVINEAGGYKNNAEIISNTKILKNTKLFINSKRIKNKVNLNEASLEQLQTIKGIGPKKALSIIEYRQKYGSFKSISELKLIKGIKEKSFIKIYEYFCL